MIGFCDNGDGPPCSMQTSSSGTNITIILRHELKTSVCIQQDKWTAGNKTMRPICVQELWSMCWLQRRRSDVYPVTQANVRAQRHDKRRRCVTGCRGVLKTLQSLSNDVKGARFQVTTLALTKARMSQHFSLSAA